MFFSSSGVLKAISASLCLVLGKPAAVSSCVYCDLVLGAVYSSRVIPLTLPLGNGADTTLAGTRSPKDLFIDTSGSLDVDSIFLPNSACLPDAPFEPPIPTSTPSSKSVKGINPSCSNTSALVISE